MRHRLGPYVAFAAFGVFWGTWGASLPALRDAAALTEAQLGGALLCVGVGALPAMLFTGRAVDRFGVRVTGVLLVMLAGAGMVIAWQGRDLASVALGMLLVGATSGASDVAANALAAREEARSTRRVITLAHGVFSASVVLGSLGAGALRASGADAVLVFGVAGAVIAAAGVSVLVSGDGPIGARVGVPGSTPRGDGGSRAWPLVAIGLVGALGFAAENAHQSWSAVFLEDELGASVGLAALAPATFAVFAAVTRFTVGASTLIPDAPLLVGGAIAAAGGTLLLASAASLPLALVGLALAATGTSVLFPTLLSRSMRDVPEGSRGRATSVISTTAYLGFVLGPAYVGALAGAVGLRGAMVGVAVIAAAFAIVAPAATRLVARAHRARVDDPARG
ncbi:Inner membrane protein YbjJ [Clavibacter michiganensis]|uniref:Inner membrane protein YbjJ n=1 Tax=Clavibacter michiganensis TaxID=28447 RepID=A0A251Y5V1_9MICO|nr:MFS transporter [Clavibacter michiganensis]OUE19677.1 Inner membrane protein YbjJ [Clavibacter michiganensis]